MDGNTPTSCKTKKSCGDIWLYIRLCASEFDSLFYHYIRGKMKSVIMQSNTISSIMILKEHVALHREMNKSHLQCTNFIIYWHNCDIDIIMNFKITKPYQCVCLIIIDLMMNSEVNHTSSYYETTGKNMEIGEKWKSHGNWMDIHEIWFWYSRGYHNLPRSYPQYVGQNNSISSQFWVLHFFIIHQYGKPLFCHGKVVGKLYIVDI